MALVGTLAGCGNSSDSSDSSDGSNGGDDQPSSTPTTTSEPEPSEPSTSESREPTGTTEPEPTEPESTESTEPTDPTDPTASTRPPVVTGLAGVLVPGAKLPGLNAETGWQTQSTTSRESDPPPWVCQQASLLTNGAVSVRQRTYTATAGDATASQVVARTVDPRSAKRVYGALLGNARECAQQLADRDRKPVGQVRPLSTVDVRTGQAAWGVVFSGPVPGSPDEAYIDSVLVARVGDLVSVLSMSSVGQDYNYETGQTPPEQAAPIVVARMSALG